MTYVFLPQAKILTVIVGIQIFRSLITVDLATAFHVVKVKLSDISIWLVIHLKGKGIINLIIHTQSNESRMSL